MTIQPIWAAGLMTGTVLDGNIDVALIRTDGESIERFGSYSLIPYDMPARRLIEEAQQAARSWNFEGQEPEIFARAEAVLTRAQAGAVRSVVREAGMALGEIGVVGFHGQTVLHRGRTPERPGATRQLGDGALMSQMLGVPVVYDFRSADVAAGGQGAPLAPAYHAALLQQVASHGEAAVLNLGGVGNITWTDGDWSKGGGSIAAFDTGPANAPINDFVRALGLGEMDRDGALAAAGTVDEARLARLLEHPYLAAPYPKSLDRFDFTAAMADGLSAEDGAATLTAFTAAAVGRGLDLLPRRPRRLYVSGGGRHNPVLMAMIAARAAVEVLPAEALGWRGDAVEAECFAYLAVRVLRGLPISFPETTGAPKAMTGGRVAR